MKNTQVQTTPTNLLSSSRNTKKWSSFIMTLTWKVISWIKRKITLPCTIRYWKNKILWPFKFKAKWTWLSKNSCASLQKFNFMISMFPSTTKPLVSGKSPGTKRLAGLKYLFLYWTTGKHTLKLKPMIVWTHKTVSSYSVKTSKNSIWTNFQSNTSLKAWLISTTSFSYSHTPRLPNRKEKSEWPLVLT